MSKKVHNFYAGPAVLPEVALKRAHEEFFNFANSGISVMEISHRSPEFDALNDEAQALMRELLDIPKNYKILFLQGGASLQFGMIPMNFLTPETSADYVLTGVWSEKALKEAKRYGKTNIAGTTSEIKYVRVPRQEELKLDPNAQFFHITSNNTIYGTQWHSFPEVGNVPLICDMSSDMMWRKFDIRKFGMVYAGAQKNIGPSGLVVAIVRDDLLAKCPSHLCTMLNYKTHSENNSLYNTPNTWGIYILRNVLQWMKDMGGLEAIEKNNLKKAAYIYDVIDAFPSFYEGHAEKASRSTMNITFRLKNKDLEKKFIAEAEAMNLLGLKGHRDVGGCRASTYNSLPLESAQVLAEFMTSFANKNA